MLRSNVASETPDFKFIEEKDHIDLVLKKFDKNLPAYLSKLFSEPTGDLAKLANFGTVVKKNLKPADQIKKLDEFFHHGREKNYKDEVSSYVDMFNEKKMEEYLELDPREFKGVLKKNCPVIRYAVWSKSERLQEWQEKFARAHAQDLLDIIANSLEFAHNYSTENTEPIYKERFMVSDFLDLKDFSIEDNYFMPGVIGAGIKSTIIYYLYPSLFNRSVKTTLYAMYFLSDEDHFGLPSKTNEFIMIDDSSSYKRKRGSESNYLIDQNYWYPYYLFMFYSKYLYDNMKQICMKEAKYILDPKSRYVDLFTFLDFICLQHADQIKTMTGVDQKKDKNQI